MKKVCLFIFILATTFANGAMADSCPLGAKEDHLTIQRVMINYGKYVGAADNLALLGARYPNETVTAADMSDVISKLGLAIACAQAILDNPTGDRLPGKTYFLKDQELKDFVDDFLYFTEEFRDALIHYRSSFTKLSEAAPAARDWETLYTESKELNELIDRAHRKTSAHGTESMTEAMPPAGATLKANMKEIQSRIKAITASAADPAQKAANIALADEAARLFAICKTQPPDALLKLPDAQKQKALTDYQNMIQQAVDLVLNLKASLTANNAASVQTILAQLKQIKTDGHDRFDP